ncbi:MAG TPA: GC-type dockerin domain-anchored protein [Phycisphaerales bacterium]|nr:GC-type dockerin domain-anchored protein [Phycisphaerales bacterium]
MHRLKLTTVGLVVAAGFAAARAGEIQTLPSLGGWASFAYDVNEHGQVVGEAYLAGDEVAHAVLWTDGVATDLGAIAGSSAAWAINDGGQVVGWSGTGGFLNTAVLWENGSLLDLGADMHAAGSSVAWDITEGGLVVGQASLDGGFPAGFVWNGPGTGMEAGTIPGYNGGANKGVNESGVTVGHGYFFGDPDRAMMGVPDGEGGYEAFEIGPPGYTFSIATEINDAGTIVGFANDGNGPWNAAIFTLDGDNPVVSLGTLPGLENSEAYDVNEAGVIVGTAWDNDFLLDPRAWVYFGGAMHDLNDLLGPGQTEWAVLLSAEGINDRGDVVGYGVTTGGEVRGFLFSGVAPGPCAGSDVNSDGRVDTQDVLAFLNLWAAGDPGADWNADGAVDSRDVLAFLNAWVACR